MEVCSVPFSNSPSLHHGLKEAAPKRAFQLLNAALGEQISYERPKEANLSLLCVARTAVPVSRGGTQEQTARGRVEAQVAFSRHCSHPRACCCCRTQHTEHQRATALADLSCIPEGFVLGPRLSQLQDSLTVL